LPSFGSVVFNRRRNKKLRSPFPFSPHVPTIWQLTPAFSTFSTATFKGDQPPHNPPQQTPPKQGVRLVLAVFWGVWGGGGGGKKKQKQHPPPLPPKKHHVGPPTKPPQKQKGEPGFGPVGGTGGWAFLCWRGPGGAGGCLCVLGWLFLQKTQKTTKTKPQKPQLLSRNICNVSFLSPFAFSLPLTEMLVLYNEAMFSPFHLHMDLR